MPVYLYKARDEFGRLIKGKMEAASTDELTAKLRKTGYMATAVSRQGASPGTKDIVSQFLPVRIKDLAVFNFQLANMVGSGISLLTSLRTIEPQTQNRRLKGIIAEVYRGVEAGNLFSESLSGHSGIFGKFFINIVRAGEETGRLNEVLKRHSSFLDEEQELREKIQGALFYPAFIFTASLAVILFITVSIIPQFADLFSKLGIKLPLVTRMLFNLGLIIQSYWYLVILFLLGAALSLRKYLTTKRGKLQFDILLLKAPVLGALARKVCVSRFSRTLALLLSSGVPILQSLDIVKEVVENEVIAGAVAGIRVSVERGERMSESLKLGGDFPLDALEMIAIGEEAGDLAGALNKIADYYDREISYSVKKLTTIIEPLFLLVMGGIVAFIMFSVIVPVLDMVKMLRH